MTWLECVCGHSLAGTRDFAFSSHFFAASDWQEAGEQILDAMVRLLAAGAHETAGDDGDDSLGADDEDAMLGAVYACEHCGRRWLRLPNGHHA
ncbi:MAG TPA: hypothetical protein VF116_19965 [Ktedonobacterales bacterium]